MKTPPKTTTKGSKPRKIPPAKKSVARNGTKKKSPPAKRPLTIRQERFCEFIAAGGEGTESYLKAGWKCSREAAKVSASRMLTLDNVKAHIDSLRKPQTKKALLTRDRKRELLRDMAEDGAASLDARIRAMAEDSKMAGHYEPDRVEIETGPNTLQTIKERADQVRGELRKRYGCI